MKNYTAESIRNVGVFGHAGEGKTTLVETILFDTGLVDRIGKVENGTTVSDFDPEEAKRNCSINMTVEPVEWKNTKINFIDAPGGYDFYGDVASAAFLADSALIVVGAVSGPVVGAEKAMAMCAAQSKPRMMVINQMDRENASFEKVMEVVNQKFGPNVVPIQLPIMQGGAFKGFVDIINMTAYLFDGKNLKEVAVPGNLSDEAQSLYEKLTEAAAEADEELMEKYPSLPPSCLAISKVLSINFFTSVRMQRICIGAANGLQGASLWGEAVSAGAGAIDGGTGILPQGCTGGKDLLGNAAGGGSTDGCGHRWRT